jgi:hypothetical protein
VLLKGLLLLLLLEICCCLHSLQHMLVMLDGGSKLPGHALLSRPDAAASGGRPGA